MPRFRANRSAQVGNQENQGTIGLLSNRELQELGIDRIDWFKTDAQGIDLALFQSLHAEIREKILAVDIEPGLAENYVGEDTFHAAHPQLLAEGFWLSSLAVKGAVRMRPATVQALAADLADTYSAALPLPLRPSPAWCEARYLRSLEVLGAQDAPARSYILLWIFAMIEQQWGYALEVVQAYAARFGSSAVVHQMRQESLRSIRRVYNRPGLFIRRYMPTFVKNVAKRVLRRH